MLAKLILSPLLYPLWRIPWLEEAFFHLCRKLQKQATFTTWLFNLSDQGADVSYYQGTINFIRMAAYGMKFVICRLGFAIFPDTKFVEYMAGVLGVLPHNAYHYYDPRYNPIDQASKVIAILQPYKSRIKRVWLDFEFTWTGNYAAVRYWLTYRNAIRAAGYRTGIYTRATWWDSRVTAAEATEFATDPLWAAQYNTSLTLIPKGWNKAMLWQRGTPTIGSAAGVESLELDLDLWNSDFDFAAEWGGDAVPSITDGYQELRRNNSDCHIWRGRPAKVHVTNTRGILETVSSAARRLGADIAINGDGWNLTGEPKHPLSLAASDGNFYQQQQYEFRPYLDIESDNTFFIGHQETSHYNTVSGTRYLVKVGANAFATSTDPEHITERNPRTAAGYTSDGKLILCVVDGRSITSAGVTLKELATIMLEAGAFYAIELDGGGSSAMAKGGVIVNEPSDGTERPVVNHLLVWTETENPMAKNKVTITWDAGARERQKPRINTSDTYGAVLADNTVHYSEFDEVPDQDDPTNTGKRWIQLQSGWYIATRYPSLSGMVYERARVEAIVPVPDPEPEPTESASIDLELDPGTPYKVVVNGVVRAEGEA